jgi:hypothetical protein
VLRPLGGTGRRRGGEERTLDVSSVPSGRHDTAEAEAAAGVWAGR